MGAAYDALLAEFGGQFEERESTVATGIATVQGVQLNPDRMGLVFINFGAQDIFLTLSPTPAANSGIRITANGGNASLTLRDDFTLPSRQWNATSPGGASSLYVLEVINVVRIAKTEG